MRKSLLILAALLVGAPAYGADLSVKAPTYNATPCVPGSCSGWYAGFGLLGNGTNADIVGSGLNNSVFSDGGAVMINGGYQLWNGALFAALELSAGYEFTQANASAVVPGNKFVAQELIKLGYNFFPSAQVATVTPGQSAIPLTAPANLLAATTPYLVFGGMQRRGVSEWVNGAGVETIVAAGWSSYAQYLYAPSQQGLPATNIVQIGLQKHF